MDDDIFFQGEGFRLVQEYQDPIEWDVAPFEPLCRFLLDASPEQRAYFFKRSINALDADYGLPSHFADPTGTFNPLAKTKSQIVHGVEFYLDPQFGGEVKEFILRLCEAGVLREDEFRIIKCNNDKCGNITLGSSQHCNGCGSNHRMVSHRLYFFDPELRELFYQKSKVVEGVVYHGIKDLEANGLRVGINLSLKMEEASAGYEVDLAVTDAARERLLIIHITGNPGQQREKAAFERTLELGIKTLFVTTEGTRGCGTQFATNARYNNEGIFVLDIASDDTYVEQIKEHIRTYFSI